VILAMKKAYIVNLVGEESVECGIEAGLISKGNIIRIGGVPHAQGLVLADDTH